MATAVVARPVARPQARARDEEVLVWPDLVFVEFISAMLFTVTLFILSVVVNAPLLDQANADVTPNPSKAPWYLLNLQELLLHMNAAMAGIIIPTVWLILLGAFPYFDRETEGQGAWFSTHGAVKITIIAGIIGFTGTWLLILWDSGKLAFILNDWFGISGGDTWRFLENVRSMQSQLPWPEWSREITYLPFNLRILDGTGSGGPTTFRTLDFPGWLVEQAIPIAVLVGLPCAMIYGMWRAGWVVNRRDALLALFSGFVMAYGVLTLVGTAFRGQGQELVWPWDLKVSEGIPGAGVARIMTADSSAPRATGRIERARQIESRKLARRSFLRVSAFAAITLSVGAMAAGFLGFFNLRGPKGFGGLVNVGPARIPGPGADPVRVSEGKFWLVNLNGTEGDVLGVGGTGGIMALYWKCPHLGCSVPWNPAFNGASVNFPGIIGWFRCPCHGSTYSRAGVRVFGPAPRPMDTMAVTVNGDGSLNVNTGAITGGTPDNPLRAIPYNG